MQNISVKDAGFEGILYPGNGSKEKIMIVLSGSNGGMKLTKECAEFYHRNGIPALAVAMFNTKQTIKGLVRVPIEYIENAIIWLKDNGYQKIGIDGASKGSEMALVCASMFSDLSCVVVRVPSYFVSEGLVVNGKSKKPSGTSCWSYKGKELPYAPYKSRKINILKILLKEKELHLITINGDKDVTEDTIIPVEKIKAPILILSAVNDKVWPSYESGLYIENRLKENDFPYSFKHIAFPTISHAMFTDVSWIFKLAFKTERQNKDRCKKERIQLADEILNWVNGAWK
jgi:BAAT / Acyl-CoA thioester hydrolase C terminal.